MNKYLIEILKNHSSLILPGIGALMVTNKKTGDIKFNPHLTFNDGALANFIANEEKIDKVEAQNKVAKFTKEIKMAVDRGDTYDIFQFGTIFKNNNGEIAFKMADSSTKSGLDKTLDTAKKTVETAAVITDKASKAVKEKTAKATKEASSKLEQITENAKVKAKEAAKKSVKAADSAIKKSGEIAESAKKKTEDTVKDATKAVKDISEKATDKAEKTIKQTSEALKTSAIKLENTAKKVSETTSDSVKKAADKTIATAKTVTDKSKDVVQKVTEKAKEAKNTYIPPVSKEKLPDVPKIVASAENSASKTTEKIIESTKETVTATAEYVEKKKRRLWPIILLLLLIGIAIAAYFFRDKIKAYFGWDNVTKIENVNNYPDADGDGVPDFADVDLTGGLDEDGDGIDDAADLDYTHGTDADGDGIDDDFAASALLVDIEEEIDPMAMADEDGDGIPDYADINTTEGSDENENGIDDRFDAAFTMGTDLNKDCIDDSLANINVLNHLKSKMDDSDADGIPDYADTDLTAGTDVNKNGIDDTFESIEMDQNGDGLNDSILVAMATNMFNSENGTSTNMPEAAIEDETADEETMEEMETADENIKAEAGTSAEEAEPVKAVEKPTVAAPVTKAQSDYSATGNYHAIGAAFSEKSNAEGYTMEMNNKGFSATIIGRFDGLYLVSLKQYSNLGDAKSDLSSMRKSSSSAWIFKH